MRWLHLNSRPATSFGPFSIVCQGRGRRLQAIRRWRVSYILVVIVEKALDLTDRCWAWQWWNRCLGGFRLSCQTARRGQYVDKQANREKPRKPRKGRKQIKKKQHVPVQG